MASWGEPERDQGCGRYWLNSEGAANRNSFECGTKHHILTIFDSLVFRTISVYIILAGVMRIYFGVLPCAKTRRIYV